jgi:Transglycosylase
MRLRNNKALYSAILAGLILFYFIFRNIFFQLILDHKIERISQKFNLKVTIGTAKMHGFKSIRLNKIVVYSEQNDTLLFADKIDINPRILKLLIGRLQLRSLYIQGLDVRLNSRMLEFWLNRQKRDTLIINEKLTVQGFAATLSRLETQLFVTIPKQIEIKSSFFRYERDSLFSVVNCEHFLYGKNVFEGTFLMQDNYSKQPFIINGTLDKDHQSLKILISHGGHKQVKLPYLGPRWQAVLTFDSLYFESEFRKGRNGMIEVDGLATAINLLCSYKNISPEPVIIKEGGFHFHTKAGQNFMELDSSSLININGFCFVPYARYERSPQRKLSFKFLRKEFSAQSLIDAFPSGLFLNFRGMQASGRLIFSLQTIINFDDPDSVKYTSRLESKSLAITHFGQTDFRLINESFIHDVYEDDRKVESFLVGPENPDFVKLEDISAFLKFSVLTGEDGGFFYHKGFSEDAFRESIAANLKEHRFARGGSTLTMQLVKNVFLNHHKTISRKLEEALIVWMIENLHLVSKERMFEIYLNIIEWGPGVYGIKSASEYYFKKLPKDLSLNESIYLSAIIPRPKGFRYFFNHNGELKPFMADYYKLVSDIMLRRNQITETDTSGLNIHLNLDGPAKFMLQSPDTLRVDSLIIMPLQDKLPAYAAPFEK